MGNSLTHAWVTSLTHGRRSVLGAFAAVLLGFTLASCGDIHAGGVTRVVSMTAQDGTPCYVLYQGEDAKGVSCEKR